MGQNEKERLKRLQDAYAIYVQDVEPIIVKNVFICYVKGPYYEDYTATYREAPNKIIEKLLLSKGLTVKEGLETLIKENSLTKKNISSFITKYLDKYHDTPHFSESLLIRVHKMRRTKNYQAFLKEVKNEFSLSQYPCA